MQTLRMNQIEFKIFRFVTSQEIQTCTLLNTADAFLWFANWHQKPTSGFGHSFCLPAFFSTSSRIRILLRKAGPLFLTASTLPGSKLYDFTTRSERSKYFTILCLKYLPFFAKHLTFVETLCQVDSTLPKRNVLKLQNVGEQFILEQVNAKFNSFFIKENDIGGSCIVTCSKYNNIDTKIMTI